MSIRIGNKIIASNTANNLATTEEAGIIRIATDEEVKAGTDNSIAITPYQLANAATKTSVDEETITKDEDDVITAIGVKTRNDVLMYNWIGTLAEYEEAQELGTIQSDWVCYITDDDEDYDIITPTYGSDVALLDIIITNQILEGVDKIGKELQGSMILKSEYPDAYGKLYENKNKSTSKIINETISGIEVEYTQCENGYKVIDIANKEVYDNLFTTTGTANFFVIDEEAEYFYLPKTNNFLQPSTEGLGNYNEAGLPNIIGSLGEAVLPGGQQEYNYGAFTKSFLSESSSWGSTTAHRYQVNFDASDSNSIYGNSETVQPQSTNVYIYYKVGNTLQSDATIDMEAQILNLQKRNNIPFTLLESRYSEVALTNFSWIKSEGQWNNGEVYEDAYNRLVELYQSPIEGISVKTINDTYSDTDFVINTEDITFRLPLSNGNEFLPNYDKITEEIIDLTILNEQTYKAPINGMITVIGSSLNLLTIKLNDTIIDNSSLANSDALLALELEVNSGDVFSISSESEIDLDTCSFTPYKGNGSLYYYAGETLTGLNKINLSNLSSQIVTLQYAVDDLKSRVAALETNINAGNAEG